MMSTTIFSELFVAFLYVSTVAHTERTFETFKRVCYYTNWSQYRQDGFKFFPEDTLPGACTHIIFAFSKIDEHGTMASVEWNDKPWGNHGKGLYRRINDLKSTNSGLKTLLAVGGWTHGVEKFSAMVATPENRTKFIRRAAEFLRQHNFDGLDYDWEFPADRGSPPIDKDRFTILLNETMDFFIQEANRVTKPRLLVTAAVGIQYSRVLHSYNTSEVHKYVDFLNLMAYDLDDQIYNKNVTVHHSALYNTTGDVKHPETTRNVNWGVNQWLQNGAPPEKLVLGLAMYGKGYVLENGSENGLGAKVIGHPNPFSFYQICQKLNNQYCWKKVWDSAGQVPYVYNNITREWIGYEDEKSLKLKVDYAIDKSLGGIMVWTPDQDDFTGTACGKKYPLLTYVKRAAEYNLGDNSTRQALLDKGFGLPDSFETLPRATSQCTSPEEIIDTSFKKVCYYTNWSHYRKVKPFLPENMDPYMCTHIIFAFAKIKDGILFQYDDQNDILGSLYKRVNGLKLKNPKLKTLLAVGGWTHGVELFSNVSASEATRTTFIRAAAQFLRQHDFDGLDYDWEFPADRGSPASDKNKFTLLLKDTMDYFKQEYKVFGKKRLLVTAAVGIQYSRMLHSYETEEVHKYVDFLNLMAYDLDDQIYNKNVTVHHSALYNTTGDTKFPETTRNVDWGVTHWLQNGSAPPEKLVLGLAMYGKGYTLKDSGENGFGAKVLGPSTPVSFYEICHKLLQYNCWTTVWDSAGQVPYAFNNISREWIGYENQRSIQIKVDYAIKHSLGGFMIWTPDQDDFDGTTCRDVYPLLSYANKTASYSAGDKSVKMALEDQGFVHVAPGTPFDGVPHSKDQCSRPPSVTDTRFKRVCYYTNWSQYRQGTPSFWPKNIDPDLCTHIIFAFAKIHDGILVQYEDNDILKDSSGLYNRVNALKTKNPSLKTLLAVGGWTHGVKNFTIVSASPATRSKFIRASATFIRNNGFDGIDYDWEFPADRGSPASDKRKFTLLLKETKEYFLQESYLTGKQPLLVTAAIGMQYGRLNNSYELYEIHKHVDFLNLMAYDLDDQIYDDRRHTVHHTALFSVESDSKYPENTRNIDWGVQYLISEGIPRSKLVLGLAFYGKKYILKDPMNNGTGAPSLNKTETIPYYKYCTLLKDNSWTKVWDVAGQVPYMYNTVLKEWIGYEDRNSLEIKVNYSLNLTLGGVMIWSLDMDDFTGSLCGGPKYKLLTAIYQALQSDGYVPTIQPDQTRTTVKPTPKRPPNNSNRGHTSAAMKTYIEVPLMILCLVWW